MVEGTLSLFQGIWEDKAISNVMQGTPCGPVIKNLPCNAGDVGLTPGEGTNIPLICLWELMGTSGN